ncbi:MAG: metal-dependent hydrolase [Deltaproteobacteria bacterium]|nr:metal-dependent hydrolase [Deltaproteobacteria bacterium]
MASIGHVLFGLAVARAHDNHAQLHTGPRAPRVRVVGAVAFAVLALLPDLDVVAFALGIPYGADFGHRGAAHSLLAGVVLGAAAALVLAHGSRAPLLPTAVAAIVAVVSHGLFDALTDGGLGIALLWPWSTERLFSPVQPIPVAPIGRAFLSARGLTVATTELLWFLPFALFALFGGRIRAAPTSARAPSPGR